MTDLYNNKFAKKEQRKTKITSSKMGVTRVIMLMFMVIGVWHDATSTQKVPTSLFIDAQEQKRLENDVFEIIEFANKEQNIDTEKRIMSFKEFIDIILSERYENSDDELILQIKHASNPFFSFLSNYTTEEALRWLFSQYDFDLNKIKSSKLSQNIKDFIILCKANVFETLKIKLTKHEHGDIPKNPYNKMELTGFLLENYLTRNMSYSYSDDDDKKYAYYTDDKMMTKINFFDDIEEGDLSKKTEYLFLTSTEIDSFKENSKKRASLKRRLLEAKKIADYLLNLSELNQLNLDKLNIQIKDIDRLIKYLEFTPFRIPTRSKEAWDKITEIKNDKIDYRVFFINFNRELDQKIDQIYLDLDQIYRINDIFNNALEVAYITINFKNTKTNPKTKIITAANLILANDNLKKISSIDAINDFKNAVIKGIIPEIFDTARDLHDALVSSKNSTNQDNIDPIIKQINSFINSYIFNSFIFDNNITRQIGSAAEKLRNVVMDSSENNLFGAINEIKNNATKNMLEKDIALAAIDAISDAINNSSMKSSFTNLNSAIDKTKKILEDMQDISKTVSI